MKKYLSFLVLLLFYSCLENTKKESDTTVDSKKKLPIIKNKILEIKEKINIDTLSFLDYNDDGDYMLLNAKKRNEFYGFINDKNDDRSYLKGDLIEIKWKNDTIFIAGDGETPEIAEWIISTKKIKDGNVSIFRKTYKKELKYNWSKENNYSTSYLDKLYLLVENYIANSKVETIKLSIKNKVQLEYSIEQQTRNGEEYTVLGISYIFEHKLNTLKWLYYENGDRPKLYEYDLPNDELIELKN